MTSDKLREAIYKRQIAEGSLYFTILHPEFNPSSLATLISKIEAAGLDLGQEESWETVYETMKNQLPPLPKANSTETKAVEKGESNGNN